VKLKERVFRFLLRYDFKTSKNTNYGTGRDTRTKPLRLEMVNAHPTRA
jgi:hypothetical protein